MILVDKRSSLRTFNQNENYTAFLLHVCKQMNHSSENSKCHRHHSPPCDLFQASTFLCYFKQENLLIALTSSQPAVGLVFDEWRKNDYILCGTKTENKKVTSNKSLELARFRSKTMQRSQTVNNDVCKFYNVNLSICQTETSTVVQLGPGDRDIINVVSNSFFKIQYDQPKPCSIAS